MLFFYTIFCNLLKDLLYILLNKCNEKMQQKLSITVCNH